MSGMHQRKKMVMFGSDSFPLWVAESGIKITSSHFSGKAQDGSPVVIINSYGKGKAIYLNIHLPPYSSLSASGAAGEIVVEQPGTKEIEAGYQKVFRQILQDICRIKPDIVIQPENSIKEVFLFRGKQDKTIILGIIPSPKIQDKIRISVSLDEKYGPGTVYDVREIKNWLQEEI